MPLSKLFYPSKLVLSDPWRPVVCSAYKVLCGMMDMLSERQLIPFQDLIARFVSLIPFAAETLDENDGSDIWMTSEVTNDIL